MQTFSHSAITNNFFTMKVHAPHSLRVKAARKRATRPKSRMELTIGPPLEPVVKQKNPIEKKRSKKYQNVLDELKNAATELKKATSKR